MTAFTWDAHARDFWRDRARMHPHGIASTFAGLSDLLDAAEARAARADVLQARLDAVAALHRPVSLGGSMLGCAVCMDSRGANQAWPCETAEAMAARGET
jgi:hypothetical protein